MKKFNVPPIGSVVTVTTRFPDHYYYSTEKWKYETLTGRVMKPERWFRPDWFMISVDRASHPTPIIALENVVELVINGTETKEHDVSSSIQTVIVKGSKDNEYAVTIKDNTPISCTCTGFKFRRTCRHLKEAVANLT